MQTIAEIEAANAFEFNQTANKYNMSISIPKTKSMTISKETIRCKLALNDRPIEQVMSFEYLGIIASSSRNTYDEVKTQVNKAARVSGCLHHTIWKNKHMSITSKARIYRTEEKGSGESMSTGWETIDSPKPHTRRNRTRPDL